MGVENRAFAGRGDADSGGCSTVVDGVEVVTECRSSGGGGSRPRPVASPSPNPCSWSAVAMSSVSMGGAFGGGPVLPPDPSSSFEYIAHPDGSVGRRFTDGREEKGFQRRCNDGTGCFTWV